MKPTKKPRRRGSTADSIRRVQPKAGIGWRLPSGESLAEFVLRASVTPPPVWAETRQGGRL